MSELKSTPTTTWRDRFPVHPCADVFPMLSDAELDELAADIKANGLQQGIVLTNNPRPQILDGRNRLAALERLGIPISNDDQAAERIQKAGVKLHGWLFQVYPGAPDTYAAFVVSANIHRRHLTKEKRAELIIQAINAGKIDSAKMARSFSPTVGIKGGSTKDPILQQAVIEGEKHGVSKRTIERTRAKLQGKTPAAPKRAAVVKPSNAPRAFDIPEASLRVIAAVETEWKACPKQHRELLLTVCHKGFLRFAETHNAAVIDVPPAAKAIGRGHSTGAAKASGAKEARP